MDVTFRFEKEGYETLTVVKPVHEKGQLHPFFPNRIWFDQPFEITIQDADGLPVEGVSVFMDDVDHSDTDMNGKITITIPSN